MPKHRWIRLPLHFIITLILFCIAPVAFAYATNQHTPLPADQAFAFTFKNENALLQAEWQMAPGYYLYQDQLHFTFTPTTAATVQYPKAMLQQDHLRKINKVYRGTLRIPIILSTKNRPASLALTYQGCSQYGFCYPPIKKIIHLTSTDKMTSLTTARILLNDQYGVNQFLKTKHVSVVLLVFALFGLLLAFTPCVLPMIPILTSLIVGQKKAVSTKQAFFLSLAYVIGAALIYAIAGILAAELGYSLQVWLQKPAIIALMSAIFLLLALALFDLYDLTLPAHWQYQLTRLSNGQRGGHYASVFCMGMLSALIVSPCITAPLAGVLLYIAQTGDAVLGGMSLFIMGFCMGIPLIIIGSSAGKWLPKRGPWMVGIKRLCGIVMVAMAIILLTRFVLPFAHHTKPPVSVVVVTELPDALQQLAAAKAAHRPVMLDFYANWCASCVAMDKTVFAKEKVKQALFTKKYVLLRADLSANQVEEQALMTHFAVMAPPAVLFFDANGKPRTTMRIDGEVNATVFLMHLDD